MPLPSNVRAGAALLALLTLPAAAAAFEFSGTKTLSATVADGSRVVLGTVEFTPATDGAAAFRLSLHSEPLRDHFLSMREFKCLEGRPELTCHVPYPYAHPGTVRQGRLEWLEHSLLFFFKAPRDFGAKLWNGLYFEFRESGGALVGTPKAVDLNQIAAPPADPARAPFAPAQRHEMPASARWVRSLVIE